MKKKHRKMSDPKRFRFISILLLSVLVACGHREAGTDVFLIPYSQVEPSGAGFLDLPVWDVISPVSVFHAPWDGLEDSTVFRCFATDSLFCFRFDVLDGTLALKEDFGNEMDVAPEDRVEVFFAPAGELSTYVGAEMDPAGRVLDYECTYYREFNYPWNFRTLHFDCRIVPGGYSVAGCVSREELMGYDVDMDGGFRMGVFRADFRPDGSVNWYSLKETDDRKADFHQPSVFFDARICRDGFFREKGIVLSVQDLGTMDWPSVSLANGINTIGTHMKPAEVMEFIGSDAGKAFMDKCGKLGIDVEHQLHAMAELLPRELFSEDSTMFRMDGSGRRVADFNCCPHSDKALDIIAAKAAEFAAALPATNHRYYFWLDDNSPVCECPECKDLSASDQALIIENRMLEAIRKVDPKAMLAHLAYQSTIEPPTKVKPAEGIFLEFAPIERQWDRPLADLEAPGRKGRMSHQEVLRHLEDNLKVFPAETAMVLEYWLDVSLASDWKKPAVNLPWHPEVFASDLATYAGYGIRNVTSFAVYMDSAYFSAFPEQQCLSDYGTMLSVYR